MQASNLLHSLNADEKTRTKKKAISYFKGNKDSRTTSMEVV